MTEFFHSSKWCSNKRQGTTSVVPQIVNFDFGFSRCGNSTENKKRRG
jgi:hypothetical protein